MTDQEVVATGPRAAARHRGRAEAAGEIADSAGRVGDTAASHVESTGAGLADAEASAIGPRAAAHRGRAGRGLGVACEGGKDVMVGTHVKLLYSDIHRMIRHLQNAIHNLTYEKAFSAKCKSHRPDLVMWSVCFFEVY